MSIWKNKEIRKSINTENLLTLDEGETPVDVLKEIILKREDLNPTGSWKDRGSAYKLTQLVSDNINEAVLSSSGNAAISLLTYANKLIPEFKLHIVVSPNTNPIKLDKIKELVVNTKHELHITENTRKKSIELSAQLKIPNLRASIDEDIVKGYWSLGFEIAKLIKNNVENKKIALFVPVSSGTALVGLTQGLLNKLEQEYLMPQIYVCQTEKVCPIVDQLSVVSYQSSVEARSLKLEVETENSKLKTRNSLADAIFDTIALRAPQVIKIIKETNGDAYAISNKELLEAESYLSESQVSGIRYQKFSYTSLLSVAGFLRAKKEGKVFDTSICITSGL